MRTLITWLCYLRTGHSWVRRFDSEQGRVFLECTGCLRKTAGWDVERGERKERAA